MRFTRNWGYDPIDKGSPGGAEAPTGDNRKKNTINIAEKPENVKSGPIYGARVYWLNVTGIIRYGTVTGECCQNITLGNHLYRVRLMAGDSVWVPGKDLYRTKEEVQAAQERRERWKG